MSAFATVIWNTLSNVSYVFWRPFVPLKKMSLSMKTTHFSSFFPKKYGISHILWVAQDERGKLQKMGLSPLDCKNQAKRKHKTHNKLSFFYRKHSRVKIKQYGGRYHGNGVCDAFFLRRTWSSIKYHHPTKSEVIGSFISENPFLKFSVPLSYVTHRLTKIIRYFKKNQYFMCISHVFCLSSMIVSCQGVLPIM